MLTLEMVSQFQADLPTGILPTDLRLLAWDIETTGLDWQTDRIACCQLATPDGAVHLVKVERDHRPQVLADLLADPQITKVFHHAPFDLRFMCSAWNIEPQNVVCTKVASKILSPTANDHSLKALLARHLGVEIDKSLRTSDWTADSWSEGQVQYAVNDVQHLPTLYACLESKLLSVGRLPLARKCFEHIPTRVQLELGGYGDVFAY